MKARPDADGARTQSTALKGHSELLLIWPPCVAMGQPTAVELHMSCAVCLAPSPAWPICTAAAALSAPEDAYGCTRDTRLPCTRDQATGKGLGCATVLTVNRSQVTSSSLQLPASKQGNARLRVAERDLGVLILVLADVCGAPTPMESFPAAAAPLPILPALACQEMQELMWSMMCEALPPGSDIPAYDSDAFLGAFDLLPSRQQNAMRWAWSTHFCALSVDLHYCLEHVPKPCTPGNPAVSDYYAVMGPLVTFLRDHQCYVTLASLLSNCIKQGLAILGPLGNLAPEDPCWLPSSPSTWASSSPPASPLYPHGTPSPLHPQSIPSPLQPHGVSSPIQPYNPLPSMSSQGTYSLFNLQGDSPRTGSYRRYLPGPVAAYQPSWQADALWGGNLYGDISMTDARGAPDTFLLDPASNSYEMQGMCYNPSLMSQPPPSPLRPPLSPIHNPYTQPLYPAMQADVFNLNTSFTFGSTAATSSAWQTWAASFDAAQFCTPVRVVHGACAPTPFGEVEAASDSINDMLRLLGDSSAAFAINSTWQHQYASTCDMGEGFVVDDFIPGDIQPAAQPASRGNAQLDAAALLSAPAPCIKSSSKTTDVPILSGDCVSAPSVRMCTLLAVLLSATVQASGCRISSRALSLLLLLLVTLHVLALQFGAY